MTRIRPNEHVVLVAHVLVDWNHSDYRGGEQTLRRVTHGELSNITLRRVTHVKLSDVPERLDRWLAKSRKRYSNAREVRLENWYIETV